MRRLTAMLVARVHSDSVAIASMRINREVDERVRSMLREVENALDDVDADREACKAKARPALSPERHSDRKRCYR